MSGGSVLALWARLRNSRCVLSSDERACGQALVQSAVAPGASTERST